MTTLHNISLKPWHTFGIEAQADTLITIDSAAELPAIVEELARQGAKPLVLGGGSNTIFTADCHRPILHMANSAIVLRATHDDGDVVVEADAGVEWDRFVQHCIANGWYGAENLVAIPGTVGAAPVQNVGAYGSEAADIVERVHAVDLATGEPRVFGADECLFGYRSSIFKTQLAGRYIITSVCFRLHTEYRPKLEYKALREALAERGLSHPTAREVADTVTDIATLKPTEEDQVDYKPAIHLDIYLRMKVDDGQCRFSYSLDGKKFRDAGDVFKMREGKWIGAKMGLVSYEPDGTTDRGWVEADWFRVTK